MLSPKVVFEVLLFDVLYMCSYTFSEENVTSNNLFGGNLSGRRPDQYRK